MGFDYLGIFYRPTTPPACTFIINHPPPPLHSIAYFIIERSFKKGGLHGFHGPMRRWLSSQLEETTQPLCSVAVPATVRNDTATRMRNNYIKIIKLPCIYYFLFLKKLLLYLLCSFKVDFPFQLMLVLLWCHISKARVLVGAQRLGLQPRPRTRLMYVTTNPP